MLTPPSFAAWQWLLLLNVFFSNLLEYTSNVSITKDIAVTFLMSHTFPILSYRDSNFILFHVSWHFILKPPRITTYIVFTFFSSLWMITMSGHLTSITWFNCMLKSRSIFFLFAPHYSPGIVLQRWFNSPKVCFTSQNIENISGYVVVFNIVF